MAARSPELRFMPEAFDRLGREYPWTRDGLSLTERRLLAAMAEGAGDARARRSCAARRARRAPTSATRGPSRPSSGWRAREVPLLAAGAGGVDRHTPVALTDAGRRVLDGAADHVALNGVDRWIGGVHLLGREVRVAVGRGGRGDRGSSAGA